ncbi:MULTISPECIES: LssY C-terminal domain-containing protein [Micrococcaceae]|uniref:LssY C-terminal domain-containing protein n=1 Tax=Micrococcaceae TaxID=1268 RepID=UPI0009DA4F64|nr:MULTISPECIES: LssY C-terminal domain-containing protein [Micrococcaceae]
MTGETAMDAGRDGGMPGPAPAATAAADTVVDRLFFTFSGLSSIWFAVLLLQSSLEWPHIWVLVVFWAALAYLVLPRLHRILTRIYLPDYFIGRSRTSDGLLGDPVNVALRGREAQIHAAMRQARWTLADPVTFASSRRIITSTLTRRSYDEAPVSPLFLFGRQQDFAYQQEVDGNPGKRHHIRFWKVPPGWLLPGGIPVDWLAAGTYDRAVGLSLFTLQVTHKIAPGIDEERDYVVGSIQAAAPEAAVTIIKDFSTGYHSRNGGGDNIMTDGDLPIVDLTRIPAAGPGPARVQAAKERRPLPTLFGAVLVTCRGFAALFLAFLLLAAASDETLAPPLLGGSAGDLDVSGALLPGAIVMGVFALAEFLLAWFIARGGNRARVTAMTLGSLSIITQFATTASGGPPITLGTTLVSLSLDILLILALSSERSRTFARRRTGALGHPGSLGGVPVPGS